MSRENKMNKKNLRSSHVLNQTMSTIPKDGYKEGEIVWQTKYKMKVVYCGISLPDSKYPEKRWHSVQLPNGGILETQNIEKYKNQDK